MRAFQDQAFEFGDFVLVPKERLLLCGGEPVPLTAKAFDLLVVLVRRSGHLVTKDELFEEVWPNIFVQETNLTVNISALRKALERGSQRERNDPDGVGPRLPLRGAGRGARGEHRARSCASNPRAMTRRRAETRSLLRRSVPLDTSAGSSDGGGRSSPPPSYASRSGRSLFGARQPESTNAPFGSVAVLPFVSDSSGNNYLADGLTEATSMGSCNCRACASHRGPARFATRGRP